MAANNFDVVSESPWWNGKYPIRRQIHIQAPTGVEIPQNYPVSLRLGSDITNNVRSDFKDIEIVYCSDITAATPAFEVLPRSVRKTNNITTVKFDTQETFVGLNNENYFIYYGNIKLLNTPERPAHQDQEWPLSAPVGSVGWSFTNPGVHWVNGVSHQKGSVATFSFYGSRFRLVAKKRTDGGKAEIILNNESLGNFDFYGQEETIETIIERDDLLPGRHTLRIKVLSQSHASSSGRFIDLKRIDYFTSLQCGSGRENLYPQLSWASTMVGG